MIEARVENGETEIHVIGELEKIMTELALLNTRALESISKESGIPLSELTETMAGCLKLSNKILNENI